MINDDDLGGGKTLSEGFVACGEEIEGALGPLLVSGMDVLDDTAATGEGPL